MTTIEKLIKFWRNSVLDSSEADIENGETILAENIKQIFGDCPVCKKDFHEHQIASFAKTVFTLENQKNVGELLNKVQQSDWTEAIKSQEFDPLQDCVAIYILKCSGKIYFYLILIEPHELYEEINVIEWNKINLENLAEIESLIKSNDWFTVN